MPVLLAQQITATRPAAMVPKQYQDNTYAADCICQAVYILSHLATRLETRLSFIQIYLLASALIKNVYAARHHRLQIDVRYSNAAAKHAKPDTLERQGYALPAADFLLSRLSDHVLPARMFCCKLSIDSEAPSTWAQVISI